jgi:transmembrane sensor
MQQEITVLLAKYFSGQATHEESAMVKAWIAGDDRNQADFVLLENLWNKAAEESVIDFDTEKALQAVRTKLEPSTRSMAPGRVRVLKIAITVAASLLLFLGAWYWFFNSTGYRSVLAETDVKEVLLDDGSTVFLRKGASLQFPGKFTDDSRNVVLTGEAFFNVTTDTTKPFIVSAMQAAIQVVGTSFLIDADTGKTLLVVKTGRVWFSAAGNTGNRVMVTAGERAKLEYDSITKTTNTDDNFMAWQLKELVFNKTPLAQVVTTLNNYYRVQIDINKQDSAQLAAVVITGRYKNKSLVDVLNELVLVTSFRIREINKDHYQISIK